MGVVGEQKTLALGCLFFGDAKYKEQTRNGKHRSHFRRIVKETQVRVWKPQQNSDYRTKYNTNLHKTYLQYTFNTQNEFQRTYVPNKPEPSLNISLSA